MAGAGESACSSCGADHVEKKMPSDMTMNSSASHSMSTLEGSWQKAAYSLTKVGPVHGVCRSVVFLAALAGDGRS